MGMCQGSLLSPFLFAVVVTESARESALRELLNAADLDNRGTQE